MLWEFDFCSSNNIVGPCLITISTCCCINTNNPNCVINRKQATFFFYWMLVHFDFLQSIFKLLYFIFTVMHNKSQRNPQTPKRKLWFLKHSGQLQQQLKRKTFFRAPTNVSLWCHFGHVIVDSYTAKKVIILDYQSILNMLTGANT